MEEDELVTDLRNRFKLSAVSLAEAEAKRNDMEMSEPVSECIADLTLRYAEQLAKDLKLFAQHARRKSVKAEDVVISAHRNRGLTTSLTSFHDELRAKEPERAHRDRRKGKKFPREDETVDPDYMPESDYTP
ncbi:protein MHF1 homolog [Syzygium oleosum]|uniref:protein MHF1 homolog n=1 Tax=Syzygium oleosum TaxID=219896 RepID=UPI0024BA6935|nr:protein MHF1 homolog [Syzygium oleosum]